MGRTRVVFRTNNLGSRAKTGFDRSAIRRHHENRMQVQGI